jgi:hypothetical protein
MDKPTYIKWPTGMLELGLITQEKFEEFCILLLKSMYGNVDAALKLFCTYKEHLFKMMGYKQSQADPCTFYNKNEKDKLFSLLRRFMWMICY